MSVFLISDTHFDHANIIDYCNRPFDSVEEMDTTMRENWNARVTDEDVVLFGGDLAMANEQTALEYASELNGSMLFVDGNHDDISVQNAPFPIVNAHYFTYTYAGTQYEFYYSHYPTAVESDALRGWPDYAEPPEDFSGIILHGHVHNNDVDAFPFYNSETQYVNLSVELVEYTPVQLDELCRIVETDTTFETITDVPEDIVSDS